MSLSLARTPEAETTNCSSSLVAIAVSHGHRYVVDGSHRQRERLLGGDIPLCVTSLDRDNRRPIEIIFRVSVERIVGSIGEAAAVVGHIDRYIEVRIDFTDVDDPELGCGCVGINVGDEVVEIGPVIIMNAVVFFDAQIWK